MSYLSEIQKTEASVIVELYHFSNVDGDEYFTSAKESVDFQGNTYAPAAIKRSAPDQTLEFKAQSLTITMGITQLFLAYANSAPLLPVDVEIFSALKDTPTEFVKIFSGKVMSVGFQNQTITATCEAFSELFRKKAPRFAVQAACNHTLYDSNCQVNPALFDANVVATVSGRSITHASFAGFGNQYFTNGRVLIGNDPRFVVDHVGTVITIQFPYPNNITGAQTVRAFAGCDKQAATCRDKFSNLTQFGGMPYCPGQNKNPAVIGFR